NATPALWTTEHLVNVVRIDFNRDEAGAFRSTREIRNQVSIQTYGESQAAAVRAWNARQGLGTPSQPMRDLIADYAARILPDYGEPLQILQRAVGPELFLELYPTATVLLTDEFVRDPATGLRGLIDR